VITPEDHIRRAEQLIGETEAHFNQTIRDPALAIALAKAHIWLALAIQDLELMKEE